MPFPWESKSVDEMQEEAERLDTEISVEQKKEVLRRLKGAGLSLKTFGGSVKAAIAWLKTH